MLDNALKLCVKIEVFKAELDFQKFRVHSQLRHSKAIISFYRRKIISYLYFKNLEESKMSDRDRIENELKSKEKRELKVQKEYGKTRCDMKKSHF